MRVGRAAKDDRDPDMLLAPTPSDAIDIAPKIPTQYIQSGTLIPGASKGSRAPLDIDELDKRIAAALQIQPRAHWRDIAGVVGTSESTTRRRAERLLQAGLIRVTATADALMTGFSTMVQLTCNMQQIPAVAQRLAEREDIRFLCLVTGRFDIVAEMTVTSTEHLANVILREFPAIDGIIHTTTETVVHQFKTSYDWSRDLLHGRADELERAHPPRELPSRPVVLDEIDQRLLICLKRDGRASYAELAALCDISEPMARRRVEALINTTGVRPVAFVNPRMLGYEVELLVWLRVDLSQLKTIAAALAERQEVRYLSATSGFSDLVCEIILPGHTDLFQFLTNVLGALSGIRQIDTVTELVTLKRAFLRTNWT